MPSTETMLAWAAQVDSVSLCAGVQAHVNLASTIKALHLIWLHGSSNRASIPALPLEALLLVEDFLIADNIARIRPFYELNFRCHRLTCRPSDHLPRIKCHQLVYCAKQGRLPGEKISDLSKGIHLRIEQWLEARSNRWMHVHNHLRANWLNKTGHAGNGHRGLFSSYKRMMKEKFGMDVWVSHHRQEGYLVQNWAERADIGPSDTTIAYLILAGSPSKHIVSDLNNFELNQHRPWVENSFGFEPQKAKPLSVNNQAKFGRMMIGPGLEPHTDESQHCLKLKAIGGEGDSDEEMESPIDPKPNREPKLLVLQRTNMRDEEEV